MMYSDKMKRDQNQESGRAKTSYHDIKRSTCNVKHNTIYAISTTFFYKKLKIQFSVFHHPRKSLVVYEILGNYRLVQLITYKTTVDRVGKQEQRQQQRCNHMHHK